MGIEQTGFGFIGRETAEAMKHRCASDIAWVPFQTTAIRLIVIVLPVEGLAFDLQKRDLCEMQPSQVQ